ncbi:MAG TPA: hypothetical protein VLX56_08960 [Nitrososphaerales archaeon]|nr:hypothetical protein [Nitrososphaerales archaeon]
MPIQVRSKEEFEKKLDQATEVRVVKGRGDSAKVKARTPDALYTYVTTAAEADSITKGLKTPIIDY